MLHERLQFECQTPGVAEHLQNSNPLEIGLLSYAGEFLVSEYNACRAFSRGTRSKIVERDNHQCVVCGATDHLEAAHYDHNKNNPNYDNPNNGRTLCTQDHLLDHINRHGSNGITKRQNEWAIEQLKGRL